MKIKLSKAQWEKIGKTAGWMKSAGGFGRFSKDLSDVLEAQVKMYEVYAPNKIFQFIKSDQEIVSMMQDEQMSDKELMDFILGELKLLKIINNKK